MTRKSDQGESSVIEMIGLGALAAVAVVGVGVALQRATRSPRLQAGAQVVPLDGLRSAPFPGQQGPDAVMIIPSAFDPSAPLRLWVYLRGFGNCALNVVGSADGRCSNGGKVRRASDIAAQLEASGSGALVLVPELRYDAASYDPGALANPNGLADLIDEALGRVADRVGRVGSRDVTRLGVMSHSGGYLSAAALVRAGHPSLRSVVLLDSLYGADHDFASWIERHARSFTPEGGFRFADVYTDNGGTADRSVSLADRVGTSLADAGVSQWELRDATTATLDQSVYADRCVIFKRSGLGHSEVPRYYPRHIWEAGW